MPWGLIMEEIRRVGGDDMGRERINAEKFGSFIAALRRENRMTQRQLAEKLYVSNKAVSKWERGLSLPDIALLEPLADTFGVTVTELLHGERQASGGTAENGMTESVNVKLVEKLEADAEKNRQSLHQEKKKRALLLCVSALIGGGWLAFLYLQGHRLGVAREEISQGLLLNVFLPLLFGIWFFFLIRERLPGYYDTEKICYYGDGVFRMHISGVYFNNANWPHILKAARLFCFLTPIFYPALWLGLRMAVPTRNWPWISLGMQLTVLLGGLFLPIVYAAKRWENPKTR